MMLRLRRARSHRQWGFTLIELLVTISIIGILAGIATIGVVAFRARAVTSACKADIESVSVAASTYRLKTGNYPAPLTNVTPPGPAASSTARLAVLSSTGYLRQLPPTTDYVITLAPNGASSGVVVATGAPC